MAKESTLLPKEEKKEEESGVSKKDSLENWQPKTSLGHKIKSGEISSVDAILSQGTRILEPTVVDILLPGMTSELIKIGQSKGKFGGGKRSTWKTTQKKSSEGNKPSFSCMVAVGDLDSHVGLGMGKAKETLPAKEKALRYAKLNIIKVKLGCGAWECNCNLNHSIPCKVEGKCGSVSISLMPAPRGTGLCIEEECKKLVRLAGIKDIYSKTQGQTRTKINLLLACFDALKHLSKIK